MSEPSAATKADAAPERVLKTRSRGVELHVRRWGSGSMPVLFLHGMGGNGHWWDLTQSALEGLDAAALDLRGHGESGWAEDGVYRIEDLAADVDAARAALGWERFYLVAHSMGARVALEYAAAHPQRLVKLAAVDFLPEVRHGRARLYLRTASRRPPTYGDPEAMAERFHLEPPGTLLDAEGLRRLGRRCIKPVGERWGWRFDWKALTMDYVAVWPKLPGIPVETLVVRGGHSLVMSAEDLQRVARLLPKARAVEIERAHHHVPLDTPAELASELLRFLL